MIAPATVIFLYFGIYLVCGVARGLGRWLMRRVAARALAR